MKKNYLLMAGLASMMAFTACNNDDNLTIPAGPNFEEDGTVFEIALSNTGVGTKATRPMGSAAAANTVNKIHLFVYKKNGSNWEKVTLQAAPTKGQAPDTEVDLKGTIDSDKLALVQVGGDEFTKVKDLYNAEAGTAVLDYSGTELESDDAPTTDHITRRATVKVLGLDDADNGDYRLVAYGYNTDGQETGSEDVATFTETENGFFTVKEDITSKTAYDYEEVFAAYENCEVTTITKWDDVNGNGIQDAGVEAEKDYTETVFTLTPSLTLTRQVAGILAYLENVPTKLPNQITGENQIVDKVAVVANHKSANTFTIPNSMLATISEAPDFNGGDIESTTDGEEELITFIMENCATNYESVAADQNDAIYEFAPQAGSNSKYPYAEGYEEPTGGKFVIKNGTIFGARYLIPYDQDYEGQTLKLVFYTKKSDGNFEEITSRNIISDVAADPNSYDIRCNNFYSIGLKYDKDNTTDDDPMDLMSDEIHVQVNDAWAVLHDMDIQ